MGSVRVQTATSFASGSLHTEVISDLAGLAAIEADWQDLLLRTPLATSYASPAWVLTWLRHFEHKHGVHAVAVRRDGELVGLAPFAQSRFGAGRLGYRLLVSAGTEHGDYGEPLLGTDPVPVAEAIAEHLSQLVHRGNVAVNLRRLDDGGAMLPAIEKRDDVVRQPMGEVAHAAIVDFAPLDDPNAYLDRLARGHDIPRRMRRLGERSESLVYDSRDADVEGTLDDMRDMLRGRWEPGTGPRLFHTPALERFTREVIRAMVDSDVAHVSSLKADGKRIAITNVFRVADRYMSDAVSHDPDPELARYGLGQAELYEMLRTSFAEGAGQVDMRAGDFPYKRKWANADRITRSLVVVAPGKLGELALNERRVAMSLRARRLRRWERR